MPENLWFSLRIGSLVSGKLH